MDLNKLGRTEQVLAAAGLVLFVVSFFPWYSYSYGGAFGGTYSNTISAWSYPSGFEDWFPILLLLAYGIVLALPAFGVTVNAPFLANPKNRAAIGLALSAFATLLFAIQGLTYPSLDGAGGPSWGYFAGLVIVIAAGVQSYRGYTQSGGSFSKLGAMFTVDAAARQQGQQQPYYGQQQAQPPYGAPGGPGAQPPYGQPQPPYGAQPQPPQQPPYAQQPTQPLPQQPYAPPPAQPPTPPQDPQQPYYGQQPPQPPYGGS